LFPEETEDSYPGKDENGGIKLQDKGCLLLITTQFLQSVKVVSWPNGAAERHFVTKRFFGSSGF
jgi:hypothetical protein